MFAERKRIPEAFTLLDDILVHILLVVKNEADRLAERREIKRRLTRKVFLPKMFYSSLNLGE